MEKYVLISFPEIQFFMVREDFSECIFVNDENVADSSYFVPENIHKEVFGDKASEMEDKYVLVSFPESQLFECMENEDTLNECIFVNDEKVNPCSYFVSERLYNKAYN